MTQRAVAFARPFLCALLLTIFTGSALAQTPLTLSFTPEELKQMGLERVPPEQVKSVLLHQVGQLRQMAQQPQTQGPLALMQALSALQSGQMPGTAPTAAPPPTSRAPGTLSEAELAAQLNSRPAGSGVNIEKRKDGFSIDGKAFIDPEGRILLYGINPLSGDFTYMVETGAPGQHVIKIGRHGSDSIAIAQAQGAPGQWRITTTTGLRLSGEKLLPGAQGFVVARTGSAVIYTPGVGAKTVAIPAGYRVADFQNGDITTTRNLLLEKIPAANRDASVETLKAIGSMLGVNKKEDYALLDIDNGTPLYLNIAAEGKTQTVMWNCVRSNSNSAMIGVNKCQDGKSFESLYDPKTGLPNYAHYYWRISWFTVPDGRKIAILQDGGLSTVSIVNLDNGNRSALFERMLGIAGFSTQQNGQGKIEVTAKMGLTRERIRDALAVLDGDPAKPETVGGISLF